MLEQTRFTHYEIFLMKSYALGKIQRLEASNEYVALKFFEYFFLFKKMAYAILKKDTEFLTIKTKDEEIKVLKNRTEKLDHENFLKSPEIDIDKFRKKNKTLNGKKNFLMFLKS